MAVITPERFVKASDIPDMWGLNMLVYGPPGSGKTHFCATAQEHEDGKDVLIADVESGTRTLSKHQNVTIFPLKEWADFRELYEWLIKQEHTFRTIAIDSLTEAQEFSLQQVLTDAGRPGGPAGIQDYGKSKQQMVRMIRAFKGLATQKGWNIIFTCLEKQDKDESTGIVMRRPDLSPATCAAAMAAVDGIGYLSIGAKDKRFLQLAKTPTCEAKIRQPAADARLPRKLEDPTMGKLLEALNK